MSKPLKPSIKALALKRIGKAEKVLAMLSRVKGLDLDAARSATKDLRVQVQRLAGGGASTRVESDLL